MRKALRRLGIGVGLLLLLVAGIWSLSRALGPTDAQERALALMTQRDMPAGRNAFAAIWLLPYDVPEDRLEAVTAEDMKQWALRPLPSYPDSDDVAAAASATSAMSGPVSVAEQRFERIVARDHKAPGYCGSAVPDCLAEVRADMPAYRAWRQSDATLLGRLQSLAQYDYWRNRLPWRADMPFPEVQHFGALPTLRALDFAEGRVDAALAGNCRDISMMRRFASSSDLLIYTMVSVAYDRVGVKLLGEMLLELPADHELPVECAALVDPPAPEKLSLCNAMRGEFAYGKGLVALVQAAARRKPFERFKLWLFHNPAKSRALLAANYAGSCGDEYKALLRSDRPARMAVPLSRLGVKDYFYCADNAIGCILMRIAAPAYFDYPLHLQDMGARDLLLATLLWLREHADDKRPLAERLAVRPAELKSPSRNIRIADGGKALAIEMYDTSREKEFELPLPSYLQDAAAPH